MKKKLLFILLGFTSITSNAQQLENPKALNLKGTYSNPVVSPNSDFALVTTPNFNGVFLLDLKTKTIQNISTANGSGYGYSWSTDGTSIFYKEVNPKDYASNAVAYKYSLTSKKSERLQDFNHNFLPSFKGDKEGIVVYTNIMTLKIEAKDLKTQKSWVITTDEGQFYNAIISNDRTKIVVNNGADLYVYPIDGSGKSIKLGHGIATQWSKDDTYVLGFMDESSDGHEVSNSDIYLFNVANGNSKKLTSTSKVFEMYPCFYGKDKIVYVDDVTGKIVIAQFNF